VFFSVIIFNINDPFPKEFSRIFYCELITPDGNKITGRKYLLQNTAGQGCLTIPEETLSGIYFLKFYTRFMRNIHTDEYKYIRLKIINPYKPEALSGNDTSDTGDLAGNNKEVSSGDPSLTIISGKKTFSPREEIRLNISVEPGEGLPARLCLSVIPESTYEGPFTPVKNKLNDDTNGVCFPETRGISLCRHRPSDIRNIYQLQISGRVHRNHSVGSCARNYSGFPKHGLLEPICSGK